MYEVFTICPHCGEETKATFDIVNEGEEEGYQNVCSDCGKYFVYIVTTKTRKEDCEND